MTIHGGNNGRDEVHSSAANIPNENYENKKKKNKKKMIKSRMKEKK